MRIKALGWLLDARDEVPAAIAFAEGLLTDSSSPPTFRRQILEGAGPVLARLDDPGLAVLRRVADHDENPWVGDRAAKLLRDAR